MKREQVTIVYATNDSYAPYMGVSIYSLIEHTSEDYMYRICILHENIAENYKTKIMRMSKENVEIEFIDVSKLMNGKRILQINRLSKEATYRLLVDQIFDYEKVLYIDCDTIVLNDVAKLYNIDVSGYVLGATLDYMINSMAKYVVENLGLPVKGYFNSGVLVINIPMFRNKSIGDKCFKLLQSGKEYMTLDQDVLNITCKENVKFLQDLRDGKLEK